MSPLTIGGECGLNGVTSGGQLKIQIMRHKREARRPSEHFESSRAGGILNAPSPPPPGDNKMETEEIDLNYLEENEAEMKVVEIEDELMKEFDFFNFEQFIER